MNSKQLLVAHTSAESKWMLAFWCTCFLWVVGFSLLYGTLPEDAELSTVAGMPAWVFWGVGLPWLLATLFTCWFALFGIKDDPLDDDPIQGTPIQGDPQLLDASGRESSGQSTFAAQPTMPSSRHA